MKKNVLFCLIAVFASCSQQQSNLVIDRARPVSRTLASFANTSMLPELASFPVQELNSDPSLAQGRGLKVIFISDNTLPLVRGSLLVPGGVLTEELKNYGQVAALGTLLRFGGAGNLSANALDETLQKLSASISSGAGPETITVSFSCLSADLDTVFPLFTDVITKPRFDESRVSLWKAQSLEEIRRRKDSPDTVAALSLRKLLFGNESILGAATDQASISAISPALLHKLASERITQNAVAGPYYKGGAILLIAGDLSAEKAKQLASSLSASLPQTVKELSFVEQPSHSRATFPELVFVEQPLTQATVYMGALSAGRNPEREAEIDLFNTYFGKGGFGSILMKRVRTELGLAYGVFGAISPSPVVSRSIMVVQTKSESVGDAMKAMFEALQQVQEGIIDLAALEEAKRAVLNAYPFSFSSPLEAATRKAVQQMQGYPPDFDSRYPKQLASAGPKEVERIAKEYFENPAFKIVVVGDKQALASIEGKLSSFPVPFNSLKISQGTFSDNLSLK